MTEERIAFIKQFIAKFADHPLALVAEEMLDEIAVMRTTLHAFQTLSEAAHREACRIADERIKAKEKVCGAA